MRINLPLLGTVPALKKGNRDEDDDSLLAVASLDLEIPGVSKNAAQCPPPLPNELFCVCVSPDFEEVPAAGDEAAMAVRPNAPISFIGGACGGVFMCGARMQRVQWRVALILPRGRRRTGAA